jgi:hypothetical protein
MKAMRIFMVSLFLLFMAVSSAPEQESVYEPIKPVYEPVYYDVVQKIMEFEFTNSDVMENSNMLTNIFGGRFSKTPAYRAAAEWCVERLKEYGLENVHLEPYEFGNGWDFDYVSLHMVSPDYMPIIGFPTLWSSSSNGEIKANVIHINFDEITSVEDLEQYRGKLDGRIVFIMPVQEISPYFGVQMWNRAHTFRHERGYPIKRSDDQLGEMSRIPIAPPEARERRRRERDDDDLRQKIVDFVFAEGAMAMAKTDPAHYFGSVGGIGRYNRIEEPWNVDAPERPLELVLAVEHYNRILRILEQGIPVEMEIEVRTNFYRGDPHDHNVIAEIPGTDLAHEIVINAAHLQSYPHGTGAIDNAAGVATAMEAMRILKAIGVQPRRTIRLGLWGGHDGTGDIGQTMHVYKHFADPRTKEYKKDYDNHVVTFNQDLGPTAMRGIPCARNEELRAIFKEWIKPLHGIGFAHIYTGRDPGAGLKRVGLLGLKFDQDAYDMLDWIAHINMDTYERLFPEGMTQSSVVVATFLYHAAMRDEKLPRVSPLPW